MKRKVVHLKDREVKADTQNGKEYSFLSNGLREIQTPFLWIIIFNTVKTFMLWW